MTPVEEHLTPSDVALELHCSRRHAGDLMRREMGAIDISLGKVPRWRVSREDFEQWKARERESSQRMVSGSDQGHATSGRRSPARGSQLSASTVKRRRSSELGSSERQPTRVTQPRVVRLLPT